AVQREFEDDPDGLVKLLAWSPADDAWSVAHYPLDAREAETGWVGLADLEMTDDGLLVLERDNQIGSAAAIKRIYRVDLTGVAFAEIGADDIPVVEKTLLRDVLPDLAATNGPVQDKVEGLTVANGEAFIVTDNDGVDDASGETRFIRLGALGASQ
ncbi:MAG: esterase-like activity of phytase family protein, partial [Pseudomonadota bacterium]